MIDLALVASLAAYAVVVSQPLAYLVFLGKAQRSLSGPAYVELRRSINAVMNGRFPVIYGATLVTLVSTLGLSLRAAEGVVASSVGLALGCLVADVILTIRLNLPINGVMDRWSPTDHPPDWQEYRTRWFTAFGYRQVVLSVGFVALLAGAAFR